MPYVYFIHEEDDLGIFKIGKTTNHPADRMDQLQTGNPRRLKLYRWICVENHDIVEEFLHVLFAPVHIHGEWFHVTPELIDAECRVIAENNTCTISGRWEPYNKQDRLNVKLDRAKVGKYRGKLNPVDAAVARDRYVETLRRKKAINNGL